jgi:hypothetical protein
LGISLFVVLIFPGWVGLRGGHYLVDRMPESKLLEDMNKLVEKLDSYDKRLTSMGSDLSKFFF